MRKYLKSLPKRSERHKHNFALFVSLGFTLAMFSVWYFVNYGHKSAVVTQNSDTTELPAAHEVTPFESLSASASQGWHDVSQKIGNLFGNFGSVNVEQGYQEMKTNTLNTYGQ